jgi:C4-dicarboxylate-specific signal transduction histidine kinase
MAAPLHRIRWPGRRTWGRVLGAGLVAALGVVWIVRTDLTRQREAFETDARIAHRLLSQRVVQHDAILATLALLQPRDDAAQRLPALYPQVLQVLQRDRDAAWPEPALAVAENVSRLHKRAALAAVDAASGRYTLVQAAEPASFALRIAIDTMVPWSEWPTRRDGPVRVVLQLDGATIDLQRGAVGAGVTRFDFSKHLAADSQPFDMIATRTVRWSELPWVALLAWLVAVVFATAGIAAWQRQREARRRAEQLLRLGQVGRLNALGELAAGMAHELNQPLTALLANTQAAHRLIADEPPDLPEAREAMTQAVQQARRASEVVARLRRVVQQPGAPSAVRSLPLAATVRDALDLLQPELARRGVVPRLGLGDAALAVQADPVAVEQIVHNLLTNALEALDRVPGAERELAIHTESDGREASLVVRDSGPGIAADALPHLFEPFFTTRPDGLGLGLSLCETLAATMGGRLTAANRSPRGAEFRLTLPRAAST